MNNSNESQIKPITITIIFEASALNRDEKLGGNIPSIKKLTRAGGETFSYLSRVAIRHYLFETLYRRYKEDWIPAECVESGKGENKVVQFDLTKQNILTNAELDVFGYMYTISGQQSFTRKAVLGITKAIALEPWEGDMQFNANHDLARRCGANPNPVSKEEHMSYFKVSFTLDTEKLGHDEWFVDKHDYKHDEKTLILSVADKNEFSKIEEVEEKEKEKEYELKNGKGHIKILRKPKKENTKNSSSGEEESVIKVTFQLSPKEKEKRIFQIIETVKNGLIYHASGENEGIVPKFMIAACLEVPIPLFHYFIKIGPFEKSILDNPYIQKDSNDKKLVYVYNPENLVTDIDTTNLYTDWEEFLKALNLEPQKVVNKE